MAYVDREAYLKLRLSELNKFDTERTMRENIYDLEQENLRIESMVNEMLKRNIPPSIIVNWMQQMENNAAEIVYMTSIVQYDINNFNFDDITVIGREE